MRINTIGIYILVCLLTHGNWNVLVSVKGDEDGTVSGGGDPTGGSGTATPEVKLYKADSDGKTVEMVENTDFEKKKLTIDKYEFKSGVKCTLVKLEDKEIWKKGDNDINEAISVVFNSDLNIITIFDDNKSVYYTKDSTTDQWSCTGTGTIKKPKSKTSESDNSESSSGGSSRTATSGGSTNSVSGHSSTHSVLKLYKDDSSGNKVELSETTDYDKKQETIDKYEFKSGVKCTLVKLGEKEIWKKGDKGITELGYVTFNPTTAKIGVYAADSIVGGKSRSLKTSNGGGSTKSKSRSSNGTKKSSGGSGSGGANSNEEVDGSSGSDTGQAEDGSGCKGTKGGNKSGSTGANRSTHTSGTGTGSSSSRKKKKSTS